MIGHHALLPADDFTIRFDAVTIAPGQIEKAEFVLPGDWIFRPEQVRYAEGQAIRVLFAFVGHRSQLPVPQSLDCGLDLQASDIKWSTVQRGGAISLFGKNFSSAARAWKVEISGKRCRIFGACADGA